MYKDPTYTGKRACLMPFFVNALFCSKIRRYDCHVFIPEMIPNYAWSPLHLFFCDADLVRLDLGQMRLAHSGLWIVFIPEISLKYHFKIRLSNLRILRSGLIIVKIRQEVANIWIFPPIFFKWHASVKNHATSQKSLG